MKKSVAPSNRVTEGGVASAVKKASGGRPFNDEPGVSQVRMLINKEMHKEQELRRKPHSVVVRLMGLDDPPASQPVQPASSKGLNESYPRADQIRHICNEQRQENHYFSRLLSFGVQMPNHGALECKDVFEVLQKPSIARNHEKQALPSRNQYKNHERTESVRKKFMEVKQTDKSVKQDHHGPKVFEEALEAFSSNRDLFLKFLGEPNSIFSQQLIGLNKDGVQPKSKRITVLKPAMSSESQGTESSEQQHDVTWERRRPHPGSHSEGEGTTPSTRIVVLKPTLRKPNLSKPNLATSSHSNKSSFSEDFVRTCSREASMENMRLEQDFSQFQDESLPSSAHSNGYSGDESSVSGSENDYAEEEGGRLSDPAVLTPTHRHPRGYLNKHSSPYLASSFSGVPFHSESSVIKEAKKRLSERWHTLTHNDAAGQAQIVVTRSSNTLGQMLALSDTTNEGGNGELTASSSRSFATESELQVKATCSSMCGSSGNGQGTTGNLLRSKSLPASATFESVDVSISGSKYSSCTPDGRGAEPVKGRSFLKGKVSSFLFSRSNKPVKEKMSHPSTGLSEHVLRQPDRGSVLDERAGVLENKVEHAASSESNNASESCSSSLKDFSASPSGIPDKYLAVEFSRSYRNEPSPTSVLNGPFEDAKSRLESSAAPPGTSNISAATDAVVRCLSWDTGQQEEATVSDELDHYLLVQNLISLSNLYCVSPDQAFAGWHSEECPLGPMLLVKFLDRKDEAAESRERRSKQRLIFDCVNAALIEIGHAALWNMNPWFRTHAESFHGAPHVYLVDEVWIRIRTWFARTRNSSMLGERDSMCTRVERAVKWDVQESPWMLHMISTAVDDTCRDLCRQVLELLLDEAVADFSI